MKKAQGKTIIIVKHRGKPDEVKVLPPSAGIPTDKELLKKLREERQAEKARGIRYTAPRITPETPRLRR